MEGRKKYIILGNRSRCFFLHFYPFYHFMTIYSFSALFYLFKSVCWLKMCSQKHIRLHNELLPHQQPVERWCLFGQSMFA